ncbi:unnamed protein product [Paramecium pentaurelia]|uniref:Uncharacterized protein n=1 Tax=Paramecium pentaurelia TaxID=43138 RepID=A0A8S1XSE8_9CILI|nr:unnamed protein product [Paramecium pentaurelia]
MLVDQKKTYLFNLYNFNLYNNQLNLCELIFQSISSKFQNPLFFQYQINQTNQKYFIQTSQIEKKLCQVHKLEITVVDFKPQTRLEDKYLCTRCLAEKVDKENLTLLQETIEMIQSMKNQSQKLNKEENTIRLTNIKSLQSSIKSSKDYLKTELNKLLQLIDQQIEQIQTEIELKETKEEIKNFDDELLILSKNYNGNYSFNIPTQQSLKEKDIVLVQLIQESLLAQSKSQHFKDIMESIEKIKFKTPNNQQMNINQIPTKEFEQHKTPCLNQICSKHNKEIIMLNLNLNEPEFSRLACVECIEDCHIQYISLKEANKRWNEFQGQQTDLISKHNFKREKTFNVAIKEIKQLKDYYNDQLSEILISINEQLIQNTQNIKDFINLENKQIFELEEKQVEKIVDLLSQKDKNKHLLEEQENKKDLIICFIKVSNKNWIV